MRIIEIRDQTISIRSEIQNAFISFAEMTASAVAVVSDQERQGRKLIGYGFNSNGRYSQSGILRERMIPRILRAPPASLLTADGSNFDPETIWAAMMTNEKPGGHGERPAAVGALDMAIWDLVAKVEEKPLCRVLADRYRAGECDPDVYVYAAGGYYYPRKDTEGLQEEFRRYQDLGYTDVKMKIGAAPLKDDLRRIEAALQVVGQGASLAVDANGRFDRETALQYAEAVAPYGLKWYEEPVDPLDYALLAEVCANSATPIATGENLFSLQDSQNLVRYGGMNPRSDTLQMDPALSYGLTEYLRILRMLESSGWSWRRIVPHGGHQFSLHIAAGLGLGGNESYPGVFQPFGGFADGVPVENGRVRLPDDPGIGIEAKANLMDLFRTLTN